jgi:hypothetical protein
MIFNRLLYYPFEIAFFARKRGRRFPQHFPQRFDLPLPHQNISCTKEKTTKIISGLLGLYGSSHDKNGKGS